MLLQTKILHPKGSVIELDKSKYPVQDVIVAGEVIAQVVEVEDEAHIERLRALTEGFADYDGPAPAPNAAARAAAGIEAGLKATPKPKAPAPAPASTTTAPPAGDQVANPVTLPAIDVAASDEPTLREYAAKHFPGLEIKPRTPIGAIRGKVIKAIAAAQATE